jgi:hypothetical protein
MHRHSPRLLEEVKASSGLNLDGDSLMNHAFGCNNNVSNQQ